MKSASSVLIWPPDSCSFSASLTISGFNSSTFYWDKYTLSAYLITHQLFVFVFCYFFLGLDLTLVVRRPLVAWIGALGDSFICGRFFLEEVFEILRVLVPAQVVLHIHLCNGVESFIQFFQELLRHVPYFFIGNQVL